MSACSEVTGQGRADPHSFSMGKEIPLFIFDEHGNPVPEPSFSKWAKWNRNKKFGQRDDVGSYTVSTVFIGVGSNLFVTTVFRVIGGELFGFYDGTGNAMTRYYTTKKEAQKGHLEVLYEVKRKAKKAA
jgi:hypothetical protein